MLWNFTTTPIFTKEMLREKNLSRVHVFEVTFIRTSNLAFVSALMTQLEVSTPVTHCGYDWLQLSTNLYVERVLEFFMERMDDWSMEQHGIPIPSSRLVTAAKTSVGISSKEKCKEPGS